MHLLTCLLVVLPLLVNASPLEAEERATPQKFRLQSKIRGSWHPEFNNLFLSYYHTGAGFADPTFDTTGEIVFLNSTSKQIQYDLKGEDFPTSLALGGDSNYAGWEFAAIEAGIPRIKPARYYFNSSGLQFTFDPSRPSENEWAGWMLCDWWHNQPQLFWIYYYYNYPLPSSCSRVDLVPVKV